MKKLLALFLSLGFLSQQAFAVTVLGDDFAGYVTSVNGMGGSPLIDTNTDSSGSPVYSYTVADVTNNITDTDASSWVAGYYDGAYLDLSFNVGVVDGAGDDLTIFLVGANGHKFDLTIGGVTETYTLPVGAPTAGTEPVYNYPISKMGIDLGPFGLTGPVTEFRITFGNGWCDTSIAGICSAVPSFVGATNVVPVPAAVWLFGSGLIGLVGIARRKQK